MSDRLFLSLMAAAAAGMIALALVWPQGLGARSPWPFGHTPVEQTPAIQAVEHAASRAAATHPAQAMAAAEHLRALGEPRAGPLAQGGRPALRPAQ